MGHRRADDDDWDDDESSWDDDDDDNTRPCPYCQRSIYEDATRCPYCENYITVEDSTPDRKPWWIVAGTILCLYAVFRWIMG